MKATASAAFFDGFAAGCLVAADVAAAGTIAAAILLPAEPIIADEEPSLPAAVAEGDAGESGLDHVDALVRPQGS